MYRAKFDGNEETVLYFLNAFSTRVSPLHLISLLHAASETQAVRSPSIKSTSISDVLHRNKETCSTC